MTPPDTEALLIDQARAGNDVAFARLVVLHQQAVRGFLRRSCARPDDAEDIAQDTFVTAWRRLDTFSGQSSLRSWLCGIAYRLARSRWRSLLRALLRDGAAAHDPRALTANDPDAALDLDAALATLPPPTRAAVALCLGAEFSHAEAAAALGLPIGTVKSHVSRGRARLLGLLRIVDDER